MRRGFGVVTYNLFLKPACPGCATSRLSACMCVYEKKTTTTDNDACETYIYIVSLGLGGDVLRP